jgi:amidase
MHGGRPARRATVMLVGMLVGVMSLVVVASASATKPSPHRGFQIEEATIEDIQAAILKRKVTTTDVVEMYLDRIKAYNGTCVSQPQGILGPVTMIKNAGRLNALITLNLRPKHRKAWGFDDRKARSMTDPVDNDPRMPDALETAAALDAKFARTHRLVGPLHGVVVALKDQYDTFDMRTTSGADAFWADDRPPDDATVTERLREAGAIILAKANMDEYAGGVARSSFGGTGCNAYDTRRDPGGSSGGSAVAVAANFVTCAIGEETGGSIIKPSRWNNIVGLVPTRELVSADGMIQRGINTRVGPMCRTVTDVAKILDAYAGFDEKDELTAFSRGRTPAKSFARYERKRLDGMRIGVIREYMDDFTVADVESIDLVEDSVRTMKRLGATIVDPGPGGKLFQSCVDKYAPKWLNQQFSRQFSTVFPVDSTGAPTTDHIGTFLSLTDLITKANFWNDPDPEMPNRKSGLENTDRARSFATASALQTRFAVQTVVYECFAEQDLDAVVYPSGNIPPAILTSPEESSVNGRGLNWTTISSRGFPALTVPAGFTTRVYDLDQDGVRGPATPAALPVGVDILALPFNEAIVFEIGTAYEAATHHRREPPGFGPLTKR